MIVRVQLPFRVLNIKPMEEILFNYLKEFCVLGMGLCMLMIHYILKPVTLSKWRKYKPEDNFDL